MHCVTGKKKEKEMSEERDDMLDIQPNSKNLLTRIMLVGFSLCPLSPPQLVAFSRSDSVDYLFPTLRIKNFSMCLTLNFFPVSGQLKCLSQ